MTKNNFDKTKCRDKFHISEFDIIAKVNISRDANGDSRLAANLESPFACNRLAASPKEVHAGFLFKAKTGFYTAPDPPFGRGAPKPRRLGGRALPHDCNRKLFKILLKIN